MTPQDEEDVRVEACVPNDDWPHAMINGHHAPYCCQPSNPDELDAEELHWVAAWSGLSDD